MLDNGQEHSITDISKSSFENAQLYRIAGVSETMAVNGQHYNNADVTKFCLELPSHNIAKVRKKYLALCIYILSDLRKCF